MHHIAPCMPMTLPCGRPETWRRQQSAGVHNNHRERLEHKQKLKVTLNVMASQVVSALLQRSGDVELNPGPTGRFPGLISLLLIMFMLVCLASIQIKHTNPTVRHTLCIVMVHTCALHRFLKEQSKFLASSPGEGLGMKAKQLLYRPNGLFWNP